MVLDKPELTRSVIRVRLARSWLDEFWFTPPAQRQAFVDRGLRFEPEPTRMTDAEIAAASADAPATLEEMLLRGRKAQPLPKRRAAN